MKVITLRSSARVKEPTQPNYGKKEVGVSEKEKIESEPTQVEIEDRRFPPPALSPKPMPFSSRLEEKKKIDGEEFVDFFKIFTALNVNLPFLELLKKMRKYAKFLREVMFHWRRIRRREQITFNEECSAVVSRRVPPKLKDPNSFTIPIEIGGVSFGKALCDLGASINLMPLSI
ncbi:uncharacterized protein [Gossypium hirsutum]|uniref:Aspartic peptidase DDI1-type domain-containing protein n=1 Tax=Gossypium hirsutum TaxID=3635 RepID=A0ABM3AM85_GOSHI|nr:uncharacterized protein LOC121220337 [Gossypium hirsutum]